MTSSLAEQTPEASFAGTAADWLRRSMASMFIATILITWKLWLSGRDYPLAPLFDWLPTIPSPLDYVLLALLLAGLATTAILRDPRWPIRIVLGAGLLLALFDQNRWQPYVVHFMVILGSLLLLPWERRDRWRSADLEWGLMPARLLLAFTYLYSGLQKFNYEFLTWIMGWLLEPMLGWFGTSSEELPQGVVILFALLAAMIEGLAGLLLFFRRTRRPAAIVLIAMHLFILLALGPLGRETNHGIWPWNIAMIAALWTLFLHRREPGYSQAPRFLSGEWWRGVMGSRRKNGDSGDSPSTSHSLTLAGVIIVFGMLPMLAFADLWDSYLSFSFYSGMLPEARITVAQQDRASFPPHVVELMDDQGGFDPTFWAVEEMNAAPYPEPRVLLATARELSRRVRHDDIYLQIAGKPNAFTGERTVQTFRCPRGGGKIVEEIIE